MNFYGQSILTGWRGSVSAAGPPDVLFTTAVVPATNRFVSLIVANENKSGSETVVCKKNPGAVALSIAYIVVIKLGLLGSYASDDCIVMLKIPVIMSNINQCGTTHCDSSFLQDVAGRIFNIVSAELYNSVSYMSTKCTAVAYLWFSAWGINLS
jgi:hypothetical protein